MAQVQCMRVERLCHCGHQSTDSGHPVIHVADSKDTMILTFSKPEWDAFVAGVKNGEFDF